QNQPTGKSAKCFFRNIQPCRLAARSRAGWVCAHNLRDISASTIRPAAEVMSAQSSHIAGFAPKRRLKRRASASRTRVESDSYKFSRAEAEQWPTIGRDEQLCPSAVLLL